MVTKRHASRTPLVWKGIFCPSREDAVFAEGKSPRFLTRLPFYGNLAETEAAL